MRRRWYICLYDDVRRKSRPSSSYGSNSYGSWNFCCRLLTTIWRLFFSELKPFLPFSPLLCLHHQLPPHCNTRPHTTKLWSQSITKLPSFFFLSQLLLLWSSISVKESHIELHWFEITSSYEYIFTFITSNQTFWTAVTMYIGVDTFFFVFFFVIYVSNCFRHDGINS